MKYTLYLRHNGVESFLQKADDLESLKKAPHHTITRWVRQMGLTLDNRMPALLILHKDDTPILEAKIGSTHKRWVPFQPPEDPQVNPEQPESAANQVPV